MDGAGVRAEQALLGSVLLDPARHSQLLDLVEPADMGRPWHGQVLAAMRRVRVRGDAPGLAEVYAEMENDPDLPASMARDTVPLANLMDTAPRAGNAGAYAAIVVERGIRRWVDLAGVRLTQAGESGDLEAVWWQAARARCTVGVCAARWLALSAKLRREAAPARPGGGRIAGAAGCAAAVQEETRHQREDGSAGRALAGKSAAVAGPDAGQVVGPPGREAAARWAGVEAAGRAVLRDLAAGPSQLGRVRGWLGPEHFAVPGHGAVYELMRDMDAAGKPIDPVTVCWEAARRGLPADPDMLAGGTGAFAVASAREVHRLGLLAQAAQAGRDIQADAADLTCPPRRLLLSAHERLRALEMAPQPQARPGQDAEAASRIGRPGVGRQASRSAREAVP